MHRDPLILRPDCRDQGASPLRIALTGGSGLIGGSLAERLKSRGHDLVRLVRRPPANPGEIQWSPDDMQLDAAAPGTVDAMIHLSGEPVAGGRWTRHRRDRILRSRVNTTSLISETLARLRPRPSVFLCASAIGYYGDRPDEALNEASPPGTGFLPTVCSQWEAATAPASGAGVRVCHLRFGIVLSPRGGALKSMLPAFRLGLGGRLGSGRQIMSWITLDDAVGAVEHLLSAPVHGPVNIVSPSPVSNREFTQQLAHALRRPAFLPAPAPILRLLFGRLADEALLASARVAPQRLLESSFHFQHPVLAEALAHLRPRGAR